VVIPECSPPTLSFAMDMLLDIARSGAAGSDSENLPAKRWGPRPPCVAGTPDPSPVEPVRTDYSSSGLVDQT
jgi:hypothetical protein